MNFHIQGDQKQETPMSKFDLLIQSLKQWMLTIINEASIGLYQIQVHLKDSILNYRKIKNEEEVQNKKLSILITQQKNTLTELKEIGDLNKQWGPNMSILLDKLQNKNKC